jgi:hypothetical protein
MMPEADAGNKLEDATNANLPPWVDGFGVSVSSSLQLLGCNSRPLLDCHWEQEVMHKY